MMDFSPLRNGRNPGVTRALGNTTQGTGLSIEGFRGPRNPKQENVFSLTMSEFYLTSNDKIHEPKPTMSPGVSCSGGTRCLLGLWRGINVCWQAQRSQ